MRVANQDKESQGVRVGLDGAGGLARGHLI